MTPEQWRKLGFFIGIVIIVLLLFLCSGCSLGRKSWGTATSADAFKVVMADPQSGNAVPELIAGGGSHAMLFQTSYESDKKYPTMFSYARRKSMWGMFSGSGSGNVTCVYIAGSGESPTETVKILEALSKVINAKDKEKEQ